MLFQETHKDKKLEKLYFGTILKKYEEFIHELELDNWIVNTFLYSLVVK